MSGADVEKQKVQRRGFVSQEQGVAIAASLEGSKSRLSFSSFSSLLFAWFFFGEPECTEDDGGRSEKARRRVLDKQQGCIA